MIARPGLRAVLIRQPLLDYYELHLGGHGANSYVAARIADDGHIVYEQTKEEVMTDPFLRLSQGEVEAIAKAFLAEERPEDATVDALKDARSVRDRLLAMLEKRGVR